jgi:signal peptidase I
MEILSREEFEKLQELTFFRGKIVSDSMIPVLNIGDRITVEVGCKKLERFDIIVFWGEGKLICHYLWAMNRRVEPILLQTRSTRYGNKDYPIGFEDYLGKVVSHHLTAWGKIKIFLRINFKGMRS